MTIELTYNQIKAPKRTMLDRLANTYWNNQHTVDAALFLGVLALVAVTLVVLA